MQTLKYVIGKDYRPLTMLEAKTSNVSNIDYGANPNWVQARQYEDGLRQVFVEITNEDGTPFDLTGANVLFEGILPDNEHKILDNEHAVFYEDPTSGKFRFDLPAQAFTVAGQYKQAFFRVMKGYKNIATLEFKLQVLADWVISGLEPSDYISPLEKFFSQINDELLTDKNKLKQAVDEFKQEVNDIQKAITDKSDAVGNMLDGLTQRIVTLETKIKNDDLFTNAEAVEYKLKINDEINDLKLSLLNADKNLQTKVMEFSDKFDENLQAKATEISDEFNGKVYELNETVANSMSEAKTLVENKIAQMDNGVHAYANADGIKKAYPNGAQGIFVAVDTGHQWYYVDGKWTDGGVYQSEGNAEVEDSRTFSRGIQNKTAPSLTERLASEFSYLDKSIIGTQSDLTQFDVRKYASYNIRCFGYDSNYVPRVDYLDGAVFVDIPVSDMPSKLTFIPTTADGQKLIFYTPGNSVENHASFVGNETFDTTENKYRINADGTVTISKYGAAFGGFTRVSFVTSDISGVRISDTNFSDLTLIKLGEIMTNLERTLKESNLAAVKVLSEDSYTRTKNKQMPSYKSDKTPNLEDFKDYDVLTFKVDDMPKFVRFEFEENVVQKFIAYTPNSIAFNIASLSDRLYGTTSGMIEIKNHVATISRAGLLANGYEYVAIGVKNTAYVYDVTNEIVENKPENALDVDAKTQFGRGLRDYNTSTKLPRTEASGVANTITLSLDDMPAYIRFKPATKSTQKVIFYKENQVASNYANVSGKTFGNSYALMDYDSEWLTIQKYGLINNGVDHVAFAVDLSSPWVIDCSDEMTKKLNSTPNLATVGKIAVVGDSYSTGTLFLNNTWGGNSELAWGRNISQKYNIGYDQFSVGGINAKNWLTNDSAGLPVLKSKAPADLYVIALGINDASTYKSDSSYLGTAADIGTNAQTFYGSYAKIISEIKTYAPNAKIVCLGLAHELNIQFDAITKAIKEIAEVKQVAYIDEKDDGFFRSFEWWNTMSGGHPTAWGYSEMASAIERLLGKAMLDNFEYFKNYRWQQ